MFDDIKIANSIEMKDIKDIGKKIDIDEDYLELYGKYKAKIKPFKGNKQGKLILVTSTNPTPYGEGKTTISIGINDALNSLGYKSIVTLREPSLGPVFGIKGGATGGGFAQIVPMEDINLHFTGDMHAITSCNNLLCAAIDNHLFQGNELNLDPNNIIFKRCLDINDRALRKIDIEYNKEKKMRSTNFDITAASEIMAIICLSKNLKDLKERLGNILIGYTIDNKPVFARQLHIEGALTILLRDAIKPNLVQTLEGNPAIVHGGPFANIAHGCNSLIATKLALSLGDYVVTEAGFGSDLGAEKFLDIKCRIGNLKPNCIVINTTIRSLKHNGGCPKEKLTDKDMSYLEKGIDNLKVHIENMAKFTSNLIVCLNYFSKDTDEEIQFVRDFVEQLGYDFEISKAYTEGSKGSTSLALKIVKLCAKDTNFKFLYDVNKSIREKIDIISKEIYHASQVIYSDKALNEMKKLEHLGYQDLPICIAKTQYSISDDPKKLGYPVNHEVKVSDIHLCNGAGFIVVMMGNIMTMPGLSKEPAYLKMDIDEQGKITGLF